MRVDGQEPDMRRERWTSGRLVAKSIFIKDAKRRFGNCARKATELTPGGLLRVPTSELRASQGVLTADAEVSRGHIRPMLDDQFKIQREYYANTAGQYDVNAHCGG